jgi:hypothetical protein
MRGDRVRVRRGGTPAEVAAEAEVLITIAPGSQELHDVMLIPRHRARTSLAGAVISAPRCG